MKHEVFTFQLCSKDFPNILCVIQRCYFRWKRRYKQQTQLTLHAYNISVNISPSVKNLDPCE